MFLLTSSRPPAEALECEGPVTGRYEDARMFKEKSEPSSRPRREQACQGERDPPRMILYGRFFFCN